HGVRLTSDRRPISWEWGSLAGTATDELISVPNEIIVPSILRGYGPGIGAPVDAVCAREIERNIKQVENDIEGSSDQNAVALERTADSNSVAEPCGDVPLACHGDR